MLNQVLRRKKLARRNKARKDYERRRNINNNVPTLKIAVEEEIYAPVTKLTPALRYTESRRKAKDRQTCVVKDGLAVKSHVGYRTVIKKKPICRLHTKGNIHDPIIDKFDRVTPMIAYPMRRK